MAITGNPFEQPSWIKELIDKRYESQQERLKRQPIGFNFQRDPFDPSSYYKSLDLTRATSESATVATQQEAAAKEAARLKKEYEENQKAINGIQPNFVYDSSGQSRKYKLKGISPNAAKAADYFGSKYGITNIGGLGPGSVPGSDHPKGLATDFMTSSTKQGNALASDIIRNYKQWNVKYVIWNKYIWHPNTGWQKYSGPSDHTDHVHVSYNK